MPQFFLIRKRSKNLIFFCKQSINKTSNSVTYKTIVKAKRVSLIWVVSEKWTHNDINHGGTIYKVNKPNLCLFEQCPTVPLQQGDLKTRKSTGTSCQIEIHFST